jgi:AcrR family transcriptional regulator
VDLEEQAGGRRRRGPELEDALLDATWDELVEHGYAALTIDGVAVRAGTSRPVLYRRWATKPDLVRAAVRRKLLRDQLAVPDTGSLRSDLIALIRAANQRRVGVTAFLPFYLSSYFQETGSSPAELREFMMQGRQSSMDVIYGRAIARGEVDAERLTPRLRNLAFDLFRHEVLMTLKPVPDEVIEAIIDEVVLPLTGPALD